MASNKQKLKIIGFFSTSFVCYGLFYAANLFMLQQLSLEDFGDFTLSVKILATICAFLTISKQLSLNLYMPQYERSHRNIQRNGLILWLSKNLFISCVIMLCGLALTYLVVHLIHQPLYLQVFSAHPIKFLLFFLPIISFFIVLSCLFLSQGKLMSFLAPFLTVLPSLLLVTLFILGIYTVDISPLSTIFIYFACQSTILLLYLFLSHQFYTPNFIKHISTDEHHSWYTKASNYWISNLVHQISAVFSLLALAFLFSSESVGQYAVILLFILAYSAVISPLHTYLASQLSTVVHTNASGLKSMVKMINRTQLLLVLTGFSTVVAFGKEILFNLNPHLVGLYLPLLLAMGLFGLGIITSIPMRLLLYSKSPQLTTALKMLRLLLSVTLLLTLVPHYGIVGAILSDTLPLILTNILAALLCFRQLKLSPLNFL